MAAKSRHFRISDAMLQEARSLARAGLSGRQIREVIAERWRERAREGGRPFVEAEIPSQRTFERIAADEPPPEWWSTRTGALEEIRAVLPVLEVLAAQSGGLETRVSLAEATWVTKLRNGAGVPAQMAVPFARAYIAAESDHERTAQLDLLVSQHPWYSGREFLLEHAVAEGVLPRTVLRVKSGGLFVDRMEADLGVGDALELRGVNRRIELLIAAVDQLRAEISK